MKILTFNNKVLDTRTAVALGIFDGLHKGHRAVIGQAVSLKSDGVAPAVFSFKTATVTSKAEELSWIISDKLKTQMIENLGAEYLFLPEFSQLRDMSAEDFVKEILVGILNCEYVVCGADFHFGKGGTADTKTLSTLGQKYDFKVIVVETRKYHDNKISSTRIRELISKGEIREANSLLGYDFHFEMIVSHGAELGRTLDFPTINQYFEKGQVIPRYGVYASRTSVDGKIYDSVTNIGVKPTIGDGYIPLAETYILDFEEDMYGRLARVMLVDFLRPEVKFNDIDELKFAMDLDLKNAKKALRIL